MTAISEAASGAPDNAIKLKQHDDGASGRVHREPGIQRLGHAAAEEHARLDFARARRQGEPPLAAYKNRVFALGGASNGMYGGMRSLIALRQVLELGCGALVIPEQIAVSRAADAFDEMDNLKDERDSRSAASGCAASDRYGTTIRMTEASVTIDPRDRLIVALDLPSVADAERRSWTARRRLSFYKIGYQLGYAGGLAFAHDLIASGKQVFLDLKLHDIGNTVGKGVESIVKLGATFLTVHAYPQTMKAAVDARRAARSLKILAVTVLTSYDDADSPRPAITAPRPSRCNANALAGAGARHRRHRVLGGRSPRCCVR